ncbi:cation channel sperm-associated protein subunit beta-like [Anneissia japonica]|uniref:cation channel sperm-associated protein subunit beta-like n=1 Tax=Anneissia japonica TaxID=1529436 RepID=UPI001425BAD7|nr:cation channel sperm-associated protein subunit beta-like [Anneissia japonica]
MIMQCRLSTTFCNNIYLINFWCCITVYGLAKSRYSMHVGSQRSEDGILSNKLYLDGSFLNVICEAADEEDNTPTGRHALTQSLLLRGHTPTLQIFNSSWTRDFHFPRAQRNTSDKAWRMTIPREQLSNLDEDFSEEWNVYVMLDHSLEVFKTKASFLDLNKEPILQWHLGELLHYTNWLPITDIDDVQILQVTSPCTADVIIVALSGVQSVIPICTSYNRFMGEGDACYDLSQALCPDCSNLLLLDMVLTSTYLIVLTNRGVFVSEKMTKFNRGYKSQLAFNYINIDDIQQGHFVHYKLMHTPECFAALNVGLVSYVDVIFLVSKSSYIEKSPLKGTAPYTSWSKVEFPGTYAVSQTVAAVVDIDRYILIALQRLQASYQVVSFVFDINDLTMNQRPTVPPFVIPNSNNSTSLSELCLSPKTHLVYAVGSQVLVSDDGANSFTLLLELVDDHVIECQFANQGNDVYFITNQSSVYFGSIGVKRLVLLMQNIQSPMSIHISHLDEVYVMQISNVAAPGFITTEKLHVQRLIEAIEDKLSCPLSAQYITAKRLLLFEHQNLTGTPCNRTLHMADIGTTLTTSDGQILITDITHLNRADGFSIMAAADVVSPLAFEKLSSEPAQNYNITVSSDSSQLHLQLQGVLGQSEGWQQHSVGKTIIQPGLSSILILSVEDERVAMGTAVLPSLVNTEYLAGRWFMHSSPGAFGERSSSLSEGVCHHQLVPDDIIAKNRLIYLDMGDSFEFSVTATTKEIGYLRGSNKRLMKLTVSNRYLVHVVPEYHRDRLGIETLTVEVHNPINQQGSSTILIQLAQSSLTCPHTSLSIRFICGCPATKHLHYLQTPKITMEEFLEGDKKDEKNLPIFRSLSVNYRPPSTKGVAIPLSDNIYNADPSMPVPRTKYLISKESGSFKQCANARDHADCNCTNEMKYSSLARYSDCKEKVYLVLYPGRLEPRFVIRQYGKADIALNGSFAVALTELNDREDFTVTNVPTPSLEAMKNDPNIVDHDTFLTPDTIKITLLGSELYHFKMTVVHGFSYCPLEDEFQVYVHLAPLPNPAPLVIIALTSIIIGGIIFVIYLFYLNRHFNYRPRKHGSQCWHPHHVQHQ